LQRVFEVAKRNKDARLNNQTDRPSRPLTLP
jgi:hypothetical protein